jgi:hypothetical protein
MVAAVSPHDDRDLSTHRKAKSDGLWRLEYGLLTTPHDRPTSRWHLQLFRQFYGGAALLKAATAPPLVIERPDVAYGSTDLSPAASTRTW